MNNKHDILKIDSVSKSYGSLDSKQLVLKQLNLNLKNREFITIKGKSGSGKSTLLNIISGIDSADSGTVNLLGQSLNLLSSDQITNLRLFNIGFVFQAANFIPQLSILENICLPLMLQNKYKKKEAFAEAQNILEKLGTAKIGKKFPDQVSGGELQRAAIARSIIHKPKLLLADEPTGNLDPKHAQDVFALFRSLALENNLAVIAVTHDPELALLSDSSYELNNGQLDKC